MGQTNHKNGASNSEIISHKYVMTQCILKTLNKPDGVKTPAFVKG